MRILRSILLILCLVGPYLAIFIYLKNEKRQIKHEIKQALIEGIDRSELVQLTFTQEEADTQLDWEHSREFEYKGEMYDVVETEVSGDQITYWVWWDHEETTLNKRLSSLLAKALGQSGPEQNDPISDFLKFLYVVPDNIGRLTPCGFSPEVLFTYLHAGSRIMPAPAGPPPRV